jgi:type II secretory pathway pseudopilin PulG
MVVVGIIAIVTGIVIPVSAGMIARAKADSTSVEARTWLEEPRNRANAERRNFEVTFDTATNHIKVERVNADATRTLVLDRELPDGMKFMKPPGAPDTPDLFGNATAVDFDGPAPHMFTSDGSFTDANGDPSNGTIFLGKSGQTEAARAITIFGVTGFLHTWRLVKNQWK